MNRRNAQVREGFDRTRFAEMDRPRQAFYVNSLRRREIIPIFKTIRDETLRFIGADRNPRPLLRAAALRERCERLRRLLRDRKSVV